MQLGFKVLYLDSLAYNPEIDGHSLDDKSWHVKKQFCSQIDRYPDHGQLPMSKEYEHLPSWQQVHIVKASAKTLSSYFVVFAYIAYNLAQS
jgi:hypothetical protein